LGAYLILILLLVFMLMGVPVAFSIGASSALWLIITNYKPIILVAQSLVMGCNSFPLLAVPIFILMGVIMGGGGISKRIIQWCESFIGNRRSGLGTITVVACMFFAALTGSGPATVAAIGSLLHSSKYSYDYLWSDDESFNS